MTVAPDPGPSSPGPPDPGPPDPGPPDPDLQAMAEDELTRALTLSWRELAKVTPWGDTFSGVSPAGRDVQVERSYLWAAAPGGEVLCEVVVYVDAPRYDRGARASRRVTAAAVR